MASKLFQTIADFESGRDAIAKRAYGVIEVAAGELVGIHLRPWPKVISVVEAKWLGGWQHERREKDHCLLYYNQPIAHRNFLALKYTVTSLGTTYKTFRRTLVVLDEIAKLKRTDAIVAEVTNARLSDRFMRRCGWEQHLENQKGRHYIKRFYGQYPTAAIAGEILRAEPAFRTTSLTPNLVPNLKIHVPNSTNQLT